MLHISPGITIYILTITFILGLLPRKLCGLRGGTASFRRVSGCRAVPL